MVELSLSLKHTVEVYLVLRQCRGISVSKTMLRFLWFWGKVEISLSLKHSVEVSLVLRHCWGFSVSEKMLRFLCLWENAGVSVSEKMLRFLCPWYSADFALSLRQRWGFSLWDTRTVFSLITSLRPQPLLKCYTLSVYKVAPGLCHTTTNTVCRKLVS